MNVDNCELWENWHWVQEIKRYAGAYSNNNVHFLLDSCTGMGMTGTLWIRQESRWDRNMSLPGWLVGVWWHLQHKWAISCHDFHGNV